MAGFGLPNFGQLTEAFKKAQEIQQNAQALQDELDGMEIEDEAATVEPASGCPEISNHCGLNSTRHCCRKVSKLRKLQRWKP